MFRSIHPMLVLLAMVLLSSTASSQKLDSKSLTDILSKQGFTGQLYGNVKVTLTRLGAMKCNAETLQVYYYTGEETNPPGRAIHFSQRLIFIDNREYLGQYVIADRPTLLRLQTLRFPYSRDDGNTIQCGQEGLPELVHLDGSDIPLER
jgi:hypothetical protein